MHQAWIFHPAVPFAALAALAALAIGMALCLYLFISLKRELRGIDARWTRKLAALETECNTRLEAVDERWKELSHISNLLAPPAPLRSGLNITRRSQALQMARRGETPQAISAVLSIPLNEVELLIKVQQLSRGASA